MKSIRHVYKTIISCLILLLLCGCCGDGEYTYHVGTWKTAQTIQPYGYKEYLKNVNVLPFSNPGDQKSSLLKGSLDMTGTTLVTAILALANDEPIKIVTLLSNKCSALVVGNDSGIKSIKDLEGKTIAYVQGTMHHLLLLDILAQANLTSDDVKLLNIDFFDMGIALKQGNIDAFLSGEPYPSRAEIQGYGTILSYPYFEESFGTLNSAMIVTTDKINQHPEVIQALVDAHIATTKAYQEDTDIWLEKSLSFGVDANIQERAMQNIELTWDIDEKVIMQTQNLADRMLDLKMIDHRVNVRDLFDTRFIHHEEIK